MKAPKTALLFVLAMTLSVASTNAQGAPEATWELAYGGDANGLDIARSHATAPRHLNFRGEGPTAGTPEAWSPDGRSVAFARWYRQAGLYVVDAFGGRPHRLAKVGFVEDIRWSPDATMLSFISSRPGSAGAVDVIRADGTRLRRVHSGAGIVSWSPDSHSLVCLCAKAIETFNADGSGLRQLATRTEGTLGAASWSPDGSQIAYGRHCSPGLGADIFCDIAVMAADGSSKRTLVAHRATTRGGPDDGRPFWASADQLLITKWGFARGTLLVRSDMGLTTDFPTTGFRSDWAVLGADGLIGFVRPALSHPRRSEVEIVTVDGTVVERHLLPKGVDPDNPPPLWVS